MPLSNNYQQEPGFSKPGSCFFGKIIGGLRNEVMISGPIYGRGMDGPVEKVSNSWSFSMILSALRRGNRC